MSADAGADASADRVVTRPPAAAVPPAFVIAVLVTLVVGVTIELVTTYGVTRMRGFDDTSWLMHFWRHGQGLLRTGAGFASLTLMLLGFAELVRRSGPGSDGHVLRAGMIAIGVLLALALAGTYMAYWWHPRGEHSRERAATLASFWRWRQRIACVAALAATASLVVAGRRLTVVRWAGGPFLALTALMWPTRWLLELVSYQRPSEAQHWMQSAIDIWIRIGFCGALMAVATALGTSLPPAPPDMARAGQGIERIGSALIAAVLTLVVGAFVLVMTFGAQSPGLARVTSIVLPLAATVASLAMVTGMLQGGGLTAEGAPRLRLYAAAALTTIAFVITALKAIAVYVALRRGGGLDVGGVVRALPYVTAGLALGGVLCLLSALARLRRMVPEARVDEAGISGAAVTFVVLTVGGFALLRWAETGVADVGSFVLISLLVAVANVGAQLVVARVCHRVGAAMREITALPTAVATVR